MFIAIMATIMPMLEKLGDTRIRAPEAYIKVKLIMSILKSALMMVVFVVNGLANDFFIGFTFLLTTIIGCYYFTHLHFYDPSIHGLDKRLKMDQYAYKIHKIHKDL